MSAGLFVDGFIREMRVNTGFKPANLLTASVSLRGAQYLGAPQRQTSFFENALRQIASFPQVESATIASDLPFTFSSSVPFLIEGHPVPRAAEQPRCGDIVVNPGYFSTLQTSLARAGFCSLRHSRFRSRGHGGPGFCGEVLSAGGRNWVSHPDSPGRAKPESVERNRRSGGKCK